MSNESQRLHVCGDCRHWKHQPQSKAAGAVALSPQRLGECREELRCVLTPERAIFCFFPVIPDAHIACDRFLIGLHLLAVDSSG